PALPERTGPAGRRVTLHRIASEPLGRSSPRTGALVRIDQRNPCTLSGVAHRRASRRGFPCCTPLPSLTVRSISRIISGVNSSVSRDQLSLWPPPRNYLRL